MSRPRWSWLLAAACVCACATAHAQQAPEPPSGWTAKPPVHARRFIAVTANPHATDAAHAILARPSRDCTGNFFIDVRVLAEEGVTDFTPYSVDPAYEAVLDFFLEEPITPNVRKLAFHAGG